MKRIILLEVILIIFTFSFVTKLPEVKEIPVKSSVRPKISPSVTPGLKKEAEVVVTTAPVKLAPVKPIQAVEYAGGSYAVLNSYRVNNGLMPLSRNASLEASANARAYRIKTGQDSWSHSGWINHVYSYYSPVRNDIGENLGRGYSNMDEVMVAWNASPTHRANLVARWCEVGIGNYQDVWVQHFGIDYNNSCYK